MNEFGTSNVIAGCRAAGVHTLVDCGSPSTRFNGLDDCNIEGSNEENMPLVTDRSRSVHQYAWTKGLGEKLVIEANSPCEDFLTCVIQPHQVCYQQVTSGDVSRWR